MVAADDADTLPFTACKSMDVNLPYRYWVGGGLISHSVQSTFECCPLGTETVYCQLLISIYCFVIVIYKQ